MLITNKILPVISCLIVCCLDEAASASRVLIASGCPALKLKNGKVRYRFKSGFAHNTCNKGFLLAGEKYLKCTNGRWEGIPAICVRPTCKTPLSYPNHGYVYPSHRGAVLNFFCQPGYALVGAQNAFCDGISWSTHLPVCAISNKTISVNCDFESKDICGWTHDLNHNFDWTWHAGHENTTIETGPQYDHTLGEAKKGHYMYVARSSKNPQDMARLISPVHAVQEVTTYCLKFWYFMYGFSTDELRVYLNFVNGSDWNFAKEDALLTITGNHGNHWTHPNLYIGEIKENFQIIFEAVRSGDVTSVTAIDDVQLVPDCVVEEISTTAETIFDDAIESLDGISCFNRCGQPKDDNPFSCSCDQECFMLNTCCGDYEAYCLFTDQTESTDTSTDETVTSSPFLSTEEFMETTIMEELTTTNNPTKLTTRKPFYRFVPQRKESVPRKEFKVTLSDIATFPPRKTTIKTPAVVPQTMESFITEKDNMSVTPATIDVIHKKFPAGDIKFEAKNDSQTGEIIISSLSIIISLLTVGMSIAVIIIYIRRKYLCTSVRRWQSGDSQSDVRFLTGEEVLDFTLATSTL